MCVFFPFLHVCVCTCEISNHPYHCFETLECLTITLPSASLCAFEWGVPGLKIFMLLWQCSITLDCQWYMAVFIVCSLSLGMLEMNSPTLHRDVYCCHQISLRHVIVSWEPEGRYQYSKMFHWEPEVRYQYSKMFNWEPEGRYQYSKMFHWEPKRHYHCTMCVAIAPV